MQQIEKVPLSLTVFGHNCATCWCVLGKFSIRKRRSSLVFGTWKTKDQFSMEFRNSVTLFSRGFILSVVQFLFCSMKDKSTIICMIRLPMLISYLCSLFVECAAGGWSIPENHQISHFRFNHLQILSQFSLSFSLCISFIFLFSNGQIKRYLRRMNIKISHV